MGELGTRLMLVCSNVSPHTIDNAGRAAADLVALFTSVTAPVAAGNRPAGEGQV